MLSALSYWLASLVFQPEASWAELAMYRPGGDNQVWPVVTALSKFNFGDPTDALHYGKGIAGFHAVVLFPYALLFKIFGPAGYMIADAILMWCYFAALVMLLRRWEMNLLSANLLSVAITTGALQLVLRFASDTVARLLVLSGKEMVEWGFPNLLGLSMFGDRVPRPIPTEIFLVLVLYFLSGQWLAPRTLTWRQGLVVGAIMGLLLQGDPYAFSTLGLVGIALLVRATVRERVIPWKYLLGSVTGALATTCYFIAQMFLQNPDSAARFGLADYPRNRLLFLPGYAPWLRAAVVLTFAGAVAWMSRRVARKFETKATEASVDNLSSAAALSWFAAALVLAALLVQPVQLLLLGKGAQIFHYYIYNLPLFYAYAIVLLVIQLERVAKASDELRSGPQLTAQPLHRGVLTTGALGAILLLGNQDSLDGLAHQGVSRREVTPWAITGNNFRPSLRGVDQQFRTDELLKRSRSFLALCQEVNFLLTAFHGKRAYLPDNGFTTLDDAELERRLCEAGRLMRLQPQEFAAMIQNQYVLNYWLGCAKYWCASDYKFSAETNYLPDRLEIVRKMPKQSPFTLALPNSEFHRIMGKYLETIRSPLRTEEYPDTIVLSTVVQEQTIRPDPDLYREIYTNTVFTIYTKVPNP